MHILTYITINGSPCSDEAQESERRRLLSLWTAVHVVTKRTRRVCEDDYYIYTKKWKSTVIVRLFRVIH